MKRITFIAIASIFMVHTSFAAMTVESRTSVTGNLGTMGLTLDSPNRTIADSIKDFVDVPKGATDWKVFSTTKKKNIEGRTKDGYDFQYFKPVFSSTVEKMDGQEITIKGFMFPLEETNKQKLFMFGPFPVSCPFHYHVSPELTIEVHADKQPVKFSYEPILLEGKLQLVHKDAENGTFYRLLNAREVK